MPLTKLLSYYLNSRALTSFSLFLLVPGHILHRVFPHGDETYKMRVHLAILDWVCFIAYLFCKNIWVEGQGWSKGTRIDKYIWFFFNVRMRMLEEMCTRYSTISTHAILEEWPRQEFWDRRLFYLGKLHGTNCLKKTQTLWRDKM